MSIRWAPEPRRKMIAQLQFIPTWLLAESFTLSYQPSECGRPNNTPIGVTLDGGFSGHGSSVAHAAKEARKKRKDATK